MQLIIPSDDGCSSISNCLICVDPTVCTSCDSGYTVDDDNTCIAGRWTGGICWYGQVWMDVSVSRINLDQLTLDMSYKTVL